MAHIRGLHETRGLRTLGLSGSTAERGKLTAQLSRLDHQRTLLARQLAVWSEKQRVTAHRLGLLDDEIEQLGRLIREFGEPYGNPNQRQGTRPRRSRSQPDGGARHTDVSLEY